MAELSTTSRGSTQYVTFHMPNAHEIEPILLLGEKVVPVVATF